MGNFPPVRGCLPACLPFTCNFHLDSNAPWRLSLTNQTTSLEHRLRIDASCTYVTQLAITPHLVIHLTYISSSNEKLFNWNVFFFSPCFLLSISGFQWLLPSTMAFESLHEVYTEHLSKHCVVFHYIRTWGARGLSPRWWLYLDGRVTWRRVVAHFSCNGLGGGVEVTSMPSFHNTQVNKR